MKTVLILLVVSSLEVEAAKKLCGSYKTCQECTTRRSWWFRKTCYWCPESRSCHHAGSYFNPCKRSQIIKDARKCYDLTPGVYNSNSAYTSILLSAAAYSDEPKMCMQKLYPNNGIEVVEKIILKCEDINSFHHERCFAYTALSHASKVIIVAFRGTAIRDQLLNELISVLTIPKQPFVTGGKVQNYFKHAYDGLIPCVNESVKALVKRHPNYQVLVTGHSLGGALASLTAAALAYYKVVPKSKMTLYTFGQPRVGDKEYAMNHERLVNNSWRVVHYRDIVSHLPTCNILFGCTAYKYTPYHHGIEIFYPHAEMEVSSDYKQCIKDEDKHCSDGLVTQHPCIADIRMCVHYHKYYFGMEVGDVCKKITSLYFPDAKVSSIWDKTPIYKCRRIQV